MKLVKLGNTGKLVPAVAVGCMRIPEFTVVEAAEFIQGACEEGANFFDHADIYGAGECETIFGKGLKATGIDREDIIIQSKCGIRKGFYDFSRDHILSSVDDSLKRLQVDYLDILLLHRPDALVDPEEVAETFDELKRSGKVRHFGVSNHKPMQIELLKKYMHHDLIINQLQFSIPVANMIASGIEVNMDTAGSYDRDGSVLDYSRLKGMTIQAWSPFQMANWEGCFLGSEKYQKLNAVLEELSFKYEITPTMLAASWIFRHPAEMQLVTGTTKLNRLQDIIKASNVVISREDWYKLYVAAGYILP